MRDFGEDPKHSRTLIDRYGDAVSTAAILRANWEAEGSPVHAVGGNNQLVTHPLVKSMSDQETHIARLATALNLTPESRAKRRVGSGIGESGAKDRARVTSIRKAA